ncbi:MAG: DUF1573 domain-containing protein [Bacteroidales bacterium]|nr:DUF1573 domain-containing protein [Bacteroidales bacterium]
MYHLVFLTILFLSSTAIKAQGFLQGAVTSVSDSTLVDTLENNVNGAAISFIQTRHEIEEVFEGSELNYDFTFSNTGNEPLFISNVRTSCHCTVASYPKTPVLPGSSENISLELDTKMLGQFTKVVAVYSNAVNLPRAILNIKWTVVPKLEKAEDEQPGD